MSFQRIIGKHSIACSSNNTALIAETDHVDAVAGGEVQAETAGLERNQEHAHLLPAREKRAKSVNMLTQKRVKQTRNEREREDNAYWAESEGVHGLFSVLGVHGAVEAHEADALGFERQLDDVEERRPLREHDALVRRPHHAVMQGSRQEFEREE